MAIIGDVAVVNMRSFLISVTWTYLLQLLCAICNTTGQCTDPGIPDNGFIISPLNSTFPVNKNTTFQYGCNINYTMYSSDVITCIDTTWDKQLPFCTIFQNVGTGGQTAYQSSYPKAWAKAKSALDGDFESFTPTSEEYSPWWYVDLGGSYDIHHVMIGCKDISWFFNKQIGSVVRVGFDETFTNNQQCGPTVSDSIFTADYNNPIMLDCGGPIAGRYVSVSREGITDKLALAEVMVLAIGTCDIDPGIPANCNRTSDPVLPTYVGGPSLKYECDDGYTMYGDSVVECVAGSTWSSPPLCTGNC
ncbi:seizure protein 6 homolog [Saccoglossus kowalevskii]|uniref:Uncharacterized protein LOC102809335 n=1 Tax=Saccoglossus kowalevskii TaxID=10224 RepID=A0ABM0MAN9_SACKO|nr:PREDICTED: uncharacterized protein LOC102809335 [Saccoglossus kowalevskii]